MLQVELFEGPHQMSALSSFLVFQPVSNQQFAGSLVFICIPMDFNNHCNMGFAMINCSDSSDCRLSELHVMNNDIWAHSGSSILSLRVSWTDVCHDLAQSLRLEGCTSASCHRSSAVSVTHFCGIRNCYLRVKSAALVDVTLSHERLATWERLFRSSQWLLSNGTCDFTAFAECNTRPATIQRRVKQHPTLINPLPVRQLVSFWKNKVEFLPFSLPLPPPFPRGLYFLSFLAFLGKFNSKKLTFECFCAVF